MRIAYITDNFLGNPSNGIVSQAITWANLLKRKNIDVSLLSSWEDSDWKHMDIIHLFGSSNIWFYDVAEIIQSNHIKVVWSPICDNIDSTISQRLKTYIGCHKLGLFSLPYVRKRACQLMDSIFVRSEYEKYYIKNSYSVNKEKISVVPLSMSYSDYYNIDEIPKELFCFHLSSFSQSRKNVVRLVEAAKKYKFQLVLAGNKGSADEYQVIQNAIGDSPNIKVFGFISEKQKISLYKRAKVFALPSIKEGVGIVALDAAHYGCEIVITEIGGPKEYYGGKAFIVNPFDVDDIGLSIIKAMKGGNQPDLKNKVDSLYSQQNIAEILFQNYMKITDK